jgi:hypothetical protein
MSNSDVPFHTQAAVLDRYIHLSDPGADPAAVEIILEMLRSREDLRDYFFRSGPDPAWATILWNHGFLAEPPPPQEAQEGKFLPRWDVQEYLTSVAGQIPDIVVKHVESIQAHGWYISRAIQALCYVPAEKVERVVPRIVEWLQDPQIAHNIAPQTFELMEKLAQQGHIDVTFVLFRELTAPLPSPEVKDLGTVTLGGKVVSKFRRTWIQEDVLSRGVELLAGLDIQQTVTILEENLCTALRLEAITMNWPEGEFTSWWRTAIEDTGQDLVRYYKTDLLRALRNTLEAWVQKDAAAVEPVARRYLDEKREILRRLGLYILHRFPSRYQPYVVSELRKTENLDDTSVHHEFFMLLQRGYPHLEAQDQERLIASIRSGPPPDRMKEIIESAQQKYVVDPGEYIQDRTKTWIRDRLWMLKDHLTGQTEQILNELVNDLGAPEHPAFLIWSTGGYWVQEVSPITEWEIAQMSPDELVNFVKRWQPETDRDFGPERVSYRGLADAVASVVAASPLKYADQLASIATHRPEFASALLGQFTEGEQASSVPWELGIGLCENLLANETIRSDTSRTSEGSWIDVRKSIVRLLQVGLNDPERAIPVEHLPRLRDILLALVDDSDPAPGIDRPAEGWAGFNDPATVAINHVRPSALLALVEYARFRVQLDKEAMQGAALMGPGPKRLETAVREVLTRKLDRRQDPSWAVHSVYGRGLSLLYWLDQEWVESYIDDIFPEEDDEQSAWFYVAAWDSYVIFNRRSYHPLFEMMRPKYERAIYNLSRGYVTRTHLHPDRGLAIHLVWDYLGSNYDLRSPDGQQSLLATFFKEAPPEARGSAACVLWRICEENPSELETYWPKARSLWEWRAHEASRLNHPIDFDEEMGWFAHLLPIAPESETITSLWPLLEALLPHITRSSERDMGWEEVEEYLAREVERDPVKVIQFYRLMREQRGKPRWSYREPNTRKIIETAAEHTDSQQGALSLIDWIARSGDHRYRDIYERFAG